MDLVFDLGGMNKALLLFSYRTVVTFQQYTFLHGRFIFRCVS
jgi:hypothetical protein